MSENDQVFARLYERQTHRDRADKIAVVGIIVAMAMSTMIVILVFT